MSEQTGKQVTGIKGAHLDQWDLFGRSNLPVTHQEGSFARLHQVRRHDTWLPGQDASWTRHNTAHPGIQQAADGRQLHRPLAAEVYRGPHLTSPSHALSGTPSPAADRSLLHITPQRRWPSGPVASHLADLTHYTPAADHNYYTTTKSSPYCTTLDTNKYCYICVWYCGSLSGQSYSIPQTNINFWR